MLIRELVVIATLLIVGGAIASIVWRVMTADRRERALDEAVQKASANEGTKGKK